MTIQPIKPHEHWCTRQAQTHTTCYRQVRVVTIAADVTATIEINKSWGVPALITIVVDRGPHRSIIPLHAEAALVIGHALDEAVGLVLG